MAVERTLVMVKPDGVLMGATEDILKEYLSYGLQLIDRYNDVVFSLETAAEFYSEHEGQFYFPGLRTALSHNPCTVFVFEGEDAIQQVRAINGATNPKEAAEGTIRQKYMSAGGPCNTVHSSDSTAAFERESAIVRSIT